MSLCWDRDGDVYVKLNARQYQLFIMLKIKRYIHQEDVNKVSFNFVKAE